MSAMDEKTMLLSYLRMAREAMLWKLDGLDEYDVRRPLTATGTNLLGLVKHVAAVEHGYFSESFGAELSVEVPWDAQAMGPNGDMFATADQAIDLITNFYKDVGACVDALIESSSLHTEGAVWWWPEERNPVTLRHIVVHMIAETNRHAGHADILREQLDGSIGLRADNANVPDNDSGEWQELVASVEQAALWASNRTD